MKLMKISKLAAAALCAVLLAGFAGSLPPMHTSAVVSNEDVGEELTDGNFTYELINGTYTITKCDPTSILKEIPEIRNGYAVTAIGDSALLGCTYIEELTIPDTITSIGKSAFSGCTSLKKIKLPKRITEIQSSTFMGCTRLASVEIPDSVSSIGNYAFYNCSLLESVKLPGSLSSIGPYAFGQCSSITDIDASACSAFNYVDGILYNSSRQNIYRASTALSGDVYIDNNVKYIEPGAFSVCVGIENLYLPSSVTDIGESAFSYCTSLKKIGFSAGLSRIAPIAFKYCSSLETLDLPITVSDIGDGAFLGCTSLSRVIIPEGVSAIGEGAFLNCPKLEQVIIPKSVTDISAHAFGYKSTEEDYEPDKSFKMSVYSGSAGESYAKSNKISFSYVDKSLKRYAFLIIAAALLLAAVVLAVILMAKGRKGVPASVKKAEKAERERLEEESYEKILAADEPESESTGDEVSDDTDE